MYSCFTYANRLNRIAQGQRSTCTITAFVNSRTPKDPGWRFVYKTVIRTQILKQIVVLSVNTPTKFLSFDLYSAIQFHKKKECRTITRLQTPTPMGFTKRDPVDTPFTGTNLSVSSGRLSRKFILQIERSTIWRFVLQTVIQNFFY